MTLFVYVDNSNLWIEGMRISAVRKASRARSTTKFNPCARTGFACSLSGA